MQYANKTEVFNWTVLALGQTAPIISADNDMTLTAKILRQWYEMSMTKALDLTDWRCFRKSAALTLVDDDYSDTWKYRYSIPADCHNILRLAIENYFPNIDSRPERKVPFELLYDGATIGILTNLQDAYAQYTARPASGSGLPHPFAEVLSLVMAQNAGPALITNNWVKMKDAFLKDARQKISHQIATDLGQQPERLAPASSFADARQD